MGAVVTLAPRGIRNNNPMNLRRTRDQWLGLAPVQTDPEYFQFASLQYGLRAGGVVLLNYQSRYGLNTVRGIIARYAPEHENPTDAYIANVAARLKIGAAEPFDVAARLRELMRAIVIQENGAAPAALYVPPAVYDTALMLIGQRVT
jgi:hypothetical protein